MIFPQNLVKNPFLLAVVIIHLTKDLSLLHDIAAIKYGKCKEQANAVVNFVVAELIKGVSSLYYISWCL